MERSAVEMEFDLLERRTDGVVTWRGVARGLVAAQAQARRLAMETGNPCYVALAAQEAAPAPALEELAA